MIVCRIFESLAVCYHHHFPEHERLLIFELLVDFRLDAFCNIDDGFLEITFLWVEILCLPENKLGWAHCQIRKRSPL